MNPFFFVLDHPYRALALAGWLCIGIATVSMTTYALTRNLLTLYIKYDEGGWTFPPFEWAVRWAGVWVLLAVDAWLLGVLGTLFT